MWTLELYSTSRLGMSRGKQLSMYIAHILVRVTSQAFPETRDFSPDVVHLTS